MNASPHPIKIAILDDYQHVALQMADWTALQGRASIDAFFDTIADPDALVARLLPYDVVCVMRERTPLPRTIIERLPQLKLIASTGPKNASIDQDAAKARGIVVTDTKGSLVAPMELTWALILAASRHVTSEAASLRAGGWQEKVGHEIKGKTLGILGLGRIGAEVARIGMAFGMDAITWDERVTQKDADAAGARLVSKDQFFKEADFLSIHLVLVDATRGLVAGPELGLMKRTAWLINTSRGPIVDEAALVAALASRQLAGAALDVFDTEPLPAMHPFRTLDNVLATPHLGYVSREQYQVWFGGLVESVTAWMDAQAPGSTTAPPARAAG